MSPIRFSWLNIWLVSFCSTFKTFLGFWEPQNDAETENTTEYSDFDSFSLSNVFSMRMGISWRRWNAILCAVSRRNKVVNLLKWCLTVKWAFWTTFCGATSFMILPFVWFNVVHFTCLVSLVRLASNPLVRAWERGILAVPYVQPLTTCTNTNNIAEVEQKQRRWSYLCMCCQSLWGVEVTKAIASPERGAEAIIQGSMVVCSKWPWFNGLQELFKYCSKGIPTNPNYIPTRTKCERNEICRGNMRCDNETKS